VAEAANRYSQVIELLFREKLIDSSSVVEIRRDEFNSACQRLGIAVPRNLGDIVYSFRYRTPLPPSVVALAPVGKSWIIMPAGIGVYRFEAVKNASLIPASNRSVIKIQDATPGIIAANAQTDEQALLARLRYNRLVDTFLRITCYSLQSHLRTTVTGMGQIETDELYLGVDNNGAQYVVPVQAKGGNDRHSAVQIRQDLALCQEKYNKFICRAVGAQFMASDVIALMDFRFEDGEIVVAAEQHYRLVPADGISATELQHYRFSTGL
jgi:hypothetical protein